MACAIWARINEAKIWNKYNKFPPGDKRETRIYHYKEETIGNAGYDKYYSRDQVLKKIG